jgi:hypothetical protein
MKPLHSFTIKISNQSLKEAREFLEKNTIFYLIALLSIISVSYFLIYLYNGYGISYNDARSHLDIGRRVVEGLKPGLAQIGSVWLPLPHLLMVPTIWNDTMWHTGLAGALQSMISFVATGILIYMYLKRLSVGWLGRVVAVFVFAANVNILYLQSIAMTELLLLATMTAASYYLLLWIQQEKIVDIVKAAGFVMLSTLIRYDGWFLFLFAGLILFITTFIKTGNGERITKSNLFARYKEVEGTLVLYATLAGAGIALWFLWNLLIFKDPFYFAFGPFSAHAQQEQLLAAGNLATKGDMGLSIKTFLIAMLYNSYVSTVLVGFLGAILLWFDKTHTKNVRIISLVLLAPLFFNILALYGGHSVLFIQGMYGNTWFNVRYGIMLAPSIAIFCGYVIHKLKDLRWVIIGILVMTSFFAFVNRDAVTIDDATVGSSQKNVSEVSGWLATHAKDTPGFVLISAASHDAILFSSQLPMKKFIHEGTGEYWKAALASPDRWAHWIVLRTDDVNDLTFKELSDKAPHWKEYYNLVRHYPFADIYELKPEYISDLHIKADLKQVK